MVLVPVRVVTGLTDTFTAGPGPVAVLQVRVIGLVAVSTFACNAPAKYVRDNSAPKILQTGILDLNKLIHN